MSRRQVYGLILFLIITILPASSQVVLDRKELDTDFGLKERIVNHIIRDNYGFFYFFGDNYVQRFDGRTLELVNIESLSSNNINPEKIIDVSLMKDGTIVLILESQSDIFHIKPGGLKVDSKRIGQSLKILKSVNQLWWCDIKTPRSIGKINENLILKEALYSSSIDPVRIEEFDTGIILENNEGQLFKIENEVQENLNIKGRLAKISDRLLCFSEDSISYYHESNFKLLVKHDLGFKATLVSKDTLGNAAVFYSGRFRYIDTILMITNDLKVSPIREVLEINDKIKDAYFDDINDKWIIGTYNGVYVFNFLRDGAEFINRNPATKKSEFGNLVTALSIDTADQIYFARETRGIFKIDDSPEKFSLAGNLDFRNNMKLFYDSIRDVHFLLGFRYDGKTNLKRIDFKSNFHKNFVIPFKCMDIMVMKDGGVLMTGYDESNDEGILAKYNYENNDYRVLKQFQPRVRTVNYFEELNQYWVGAYEGLYILDDQFELIDVLNSGRLQLEKRILKDHVVTIEKFNGHIFIGLYGGGLYIIDKKERKIVKSFTEKNGLSDNNVISFIRDDNKNLWAATFNGLNVLDTSYNIIKTIYDHQGLSNREFNSKAVAKDSDGNLYFGSLNGITKINPEKVLNWKNSFGFYIDDITSYNKKEFEQFKQYKPFSIYNSTDSLVLHYRTPDYFQQPYIKPDISLDCDIQHSIGDGTITINDFNTSNVHMGFLIDGVPRLENQFFSITEDYRTELKILGIALLVILLSFFIARLIIDRNKKNEKIKAELTGRISQLQLSSLQSQMNPHFIFNALGAIQYFIQTNNTDKADEYLSDFAMLMRKILESSKARFISLTEEKELLELYIRIECMRFEKLFEYEIIVQDGVDGDCRIPPMVIQPFIENAINHGLYNLKDRKGKLRLEFSNIDENGVRCIVHDNGIGRKKAAELRLKKHKSRGMQIVSERIETINSSKKMFIELETKDLYNNDIASGTKVQIDFYYPK